MRRGSQNSLLALLLALAGAVAACGGGTAHLRGGALKAPRLKAAKPEALRQFDAGLRALRLGGPGHLGRAADRFQKAVDIDGTLWEAWHNLGVVRVRQGDDRAAVEAFSRALDVNPVQSPTRLARAEAYRRLHRYNEAEDDYQTLLKHDPGNTQTRLRLASLLREKGDLDAAVDTIRQVLRRDPSSSKAYVELGLIYLASGREELADLVLHKAAELDAKNPQALNALALVQLKRGNDQAAFELFDQATNLDPHYVDARFNKASVLMDAGDYQRALPELQAVVQADGDDLQARIALGVAYRGIKKYDRAEEEWRQVLKVAPRNADALWNLTVLYMDHMQNEAKARKVLARYLQVAPKDHPRRKDAEIRMKELGLDQPHAKGAKRAKGAGK